MRNMAVCEVALRHFDGLTAKYDIYGDPIFYPLPKSGEENKNAPAFEDIRAYESLLFD